MFWASAFFLGLVGSLHCAGMCGPLVLALPSVGRGRAGFLAGRLAYNAGRISTYTMLGAVLGIVGRGLSLAGLQRWVSITAGVVVLMSLVASPRLFPAAGLGRVVRGLKARLAGSLGGGTVRAAYMVGLLNGFLPCGLAYAACAGAVASGTFWGSTGFMAAFGLGTVPMMLALGLVGPRLRSLVALRLPRLAPVAFAVLGLLLVARGMSLGIPWISPDLSARSPAGMRCH